MLEGQRGNEHRHGKADAAQNADRKDLSEVDPRWQLGNAQLDRQPADGEHPERLADEQPQHDAHGHRAQQGGETYPLQRHPGVGKGEQRQDQVGTPGVQGMLQMLEWRLITLAVERDHEAHHHAGQGRMDARLQHRHPEHQPDQHVEADPILAAAIHPQQGQGRQDADRQRRQRQLLGVEQRDDDDDPQVIHDGQRQQKHLETHRHPLAQQRHHPEGKGDVGGGGNGPAGTRHFVRVVEEGIDQGWRQHAAHRRDGREGGLHPGREGPLQHLALHLEADQQEEDSHEAVVDPEQQRLVDVEGGNAHLHLGIEESLIAAGQAAVGQNHGQHGCHDQNYSGGGLQFEELLDYVAHG